MNLYAGQALQGIFFSFVTEMKRNKRKVQKRPELGGRKSDFRNHSKNSLCSNSFSCRFTCLAISDTRIEEDSENSTFSKDLLVRNVFEDLFPETWSAKCGNELARLACPRMFSRIYSKKRHRSPVRAKALRAIPKL